MGKGRRQPRQHWREGYRPLADGYDVELQCEEEDPRAAKRRERGEELKKRAGLVSPVFGTLLRGPDRIGALITFWIYSMAVAFVQFAFLGLGSFVLAVDNPYMASSGDPMMIDQHVDPPIVALIGLLFSVVIQRAWLSTRLRGGRLS